MDEFQKIPALFKRDAVNKKVLFGSFADPDVEQLQGIDWIWTEKIDGTNIRIHWDGHKVEVAGRTADSEIPEPLMKYLTKKFLGPENEEVFEQTFKDADVYIFGEGYGPGIQKGGGNYRKDVGFIVFDIRIGGWYLLREDMELNATELGLECVPIRGHGPIECAVYAVKDGLKSHFGDFTAEGLVLRPKRDLYNRSGKRILVKVKDCDINEKGK